MEGNASDTLTGLRTRVIEGEAQIVRVLSELRWALDQADDELRRLRHDAAHANLEVFTEAQVAKQFDVHLRTWQRLRVKHRFPHMRVGDKVLYTNFQLIEIAQILSERDCSRARKKERPHGLKAVGGKS